MSDTAPAPRTAACCCGALKITVAGAPVQVNMCSCLDCQRRSGSAFSYTAFFPEAAILSVEGEYRTWRAGSNAGRWHDVSFCPTCGTGVFGRMEAMPAKIAIAVGCFADPGFGKPQRFFWSSRRHPWLPVPEGVEAVETQ
jgi:hypothetical protein